MADQDELASSPPAATDATKRKKRKKRPRDDSSVGPAVPDPSVENQEVETEERPKKKKKRRREEATEDTAAPAEPPKKKAKRPKDDVSATTEPVKPPKSKKRAVEGEVEGKGKAKAVEEEPPVDLSAFIPAATLATFRQAAAKAPTSTQAEEAPIAQSKPTKAQKKTKTPAINGDAPTASTSKEPIPAPATAAYISSDIEKRFEALERLPNRMLSLEKVVIGLPSATKFKKLSTRVDGVDSNVSEHTSRFSGQLSSHSLRLADLSALVDTLRRDVEALKTRPPVAEKGEAPTVENDQAEADVEMESEATVDEAALEAERAKLSAALAATDAKLARLRSEKAKAASTPIPDPLPLPPPSRPAVAESESDPSEADTEVEAPPPAPKVPRPRLSLLNHNSNTGSPAPAKARAPVADPGIVNGRDLALESLRPARLSIDAAYLALADEEDDPMKMVDDEEEGSDATPVPSSEPSPKVQRKKREESVSVSEASEDEPAAVTRAPMAEDRAERIAAEQKVAAGKESEPEEARPETLEEVVEQSVVDGQPDIVSATAETVAEADVAPAPDDDPAPPEEDTTQTLVNTSPSRHDWTPLEETQALIDEEVDELYSQPPTAQPRLPPVGSPTPAVVDEPPATIDPSVFKPAPQADENGVETAEETTPPPAERTRARVRTSSRKEPPPPPPPSSSSQNVPPTRSTRASSARGASHQPPAGTPKAFSLTFETLKKARTPKSAGSKMKTMSDLDSMTKEERLAGLMKKNETVEDASPAVKDSRLARLQGSKGKKAVESESEASESD